MNASVIPGADTFLSMRQRLIRVLIGTLAGLLTGMMYGALLDSQQMSPMMHLTDLPGNTFFHLLLSALVGASFGLMLNKQAETPGKSLIWGITLGVGWWLVGPLTLFPVFNGGSPDWRIAAAGHAFPLLIGLAVTYGACMGLLYWLLVELVETRPDLQLIRHALRQTAQAAISGGLAGLLGGWVFGIWMAQAAFFPLIAGLVNSTEVMTGRGLHFGISVIIGISYGILFQRDTRTIGSSIAWGLVYGLIWWMLGPLTLMPWLLGQGVQWSLSAAQEAFPSLIGHLLYGITLGIAQASLSQLWRTLFVDSDPLTREPEGPGTRSLRALGLGAAASIGGGLVFSMVMVATDAIPTEAHLVGMSSGVAAGFVVSMVISTIIGAVYGLIFRQEITSRHFAPGWGLVYGVMWWVLGSLTLTPLILDHPLQWSLEAATGNFPSLVGHLLYGVILALVYDHLLNQSLKRSVHQVMKKTFVPSSASPVLGLLVGLLLPVIILILGLSPG